MGTATRGYGIISHHIFSYSTLYASMVDFNLLYELVNLSESESSMYNNVVVELANLSDIVELEVKTNTHLDSILFAVANTF